MPQTNLSLIFKLFSVALASPTLQLAEEISSDALRSNFDTTWKSMSLPEESLAAFNNSLCTYTSKDTEDILHETRREFTRLFLGERPLIANSEGMWRMREKGKTAVLIINSYSLEVADFMRECGVVKAEGYNDCVDFIETECDFAAFLASSPEYLLELDKDPLGILESFIESHMKLWVPGLCKEVIDATNVPYYKAYYGLLGDFFNEI